ncbi:metal ABC transporter permease [Micromonospora sp. NPDC050397]|uniref:metal ABC transporter permease n=1 Tax=Micromonospora sp. NPDC050397 TaxID=3364279 RepID=UPI00384D66AC
MIRDLLVEPFGTPFMARALAELVLLALMCGPVSVLVFVRRLSFVADALTHTVFPGVVVGYLAGGVEGVFGGALVAGLLTAIALSLLTRHGRLSEDAAIAVMLTAMFSVGVVLVSRRPSYTADLTSFLFGRVLTVSEAQLVQTGLLAVVVLAVLAVTARVLVFRAFDPVGATAAGYRIGPLDAWLNVVVALVVVAAVRAVGTVLVVALLLVPAATARLLTDRLLGMAVIGTGVTVAAGWLGLVASWTASIDFGVRLTSASAVVLALVAAYLLALPVGLLRARRMAAGRRG